MLGPPDLSRQGFGVLIGSAHIWPADQLAKCPASHSVGRVGWPNVLLDVRLATQNNDRYFGRSICLPNIQLLGRRTMRFILTLAPT